MKRHCNYSSGLIGGNESRYSMKPKMVILAIMTSTVRYQSNATQAHKRSKTASNCTLEQRIHIAWLLHSSIVLELTLEEQSEQSGKERSCLAG